jgi:transposase InsO family protein
MLDRIKNLFPGSAKSFGGFFPGEAARPTGQEEHIGFGQRAFAEKLLDAGQRFIILFFIDLPTRKVEIAGIAPAANGLWMRQIARNLTDAEQGILTGKRYLIHDRDPLFTADFLEMIADAGVESVKLPSRSPNLNAYAERFVRSIKESCLNRVIFFGEESLRTAIQNFVAHYHSEGNHQGLANQLISPEAGHLDNAGEVQRRQRLGGMLNYYYRAA